MAQWDQSHLGNPFATGYMAAPAGVKLGFDTLIPLLGVLMTPMTLAFGPSASLSLLTIVVPGLACYAMYRVARLWLRSQTGAVAAGACFGLSSMLDWQDWYHIQISAGVVLLPMTLEAAVRLRRTPFPSRTPALAPPRLLVLAAFRDAGRLALLEAGWPGSPGPAPTELAAARQDLRHLRIGWALVWQTGRHDVISYLTATGFRFSYRADGVAVYRLSVTGPGLPGGLAAAGQKGR